jgi:hypothetical protein
MSIIVAVVWLIKKNMKNVSQAIKILEHLKDLFTHRSWWWWWFSHLVSERHQTSTSTTCFHYVISLGWERNQKLFIIRHRFSLSSFTFQSAITKRLTKWTVKVRQKTNGDHSTWLERIPIVFCFFLISNCFNLFQFVSNLFQLFQISNCSKCTEKKRRCEAQGWHAKSWSVPHFLCEEYNFLWNFT